MSLWNSLGLLYGAISLNPIGGFALGEITNKASNDASAKVHQQYISGNNYPNYIKYDPTNLSNFKAPEINKIIEAIRKTGIDTSSYDGSGMVNKQFDDIIKAYQKSKGKKQDGIVNEEFIKELQEDINKVAPKEVKDNSKNSDELYNDTDTEEEEEDKPYDPHYEPYFLNESEKLPRRNHKDIVISMGNGYLTKRIKNVYMRSVGVEVDTSGKPVTEVYQFIARDVKESDAPEDENIYLGEEDTMQASSDIKYNFDALFKDK